jgi:hypothetical protein
MQQLIPKAPPQYGITSTLYAHQRLTTTYFTLGPEKGS